jgi:hypothetical protein
MDLKKEDVRMKTGITWLKQGTVAGSCKHNNDLSGSIKGKTFLD